LAGTPGLTDIASGRFAPTVDAFLSVPHPRATFLFVTIRNPGTLLDEASSLKAQGKLDAAIECIEQVLASSPRDVRAWHDISVLYIKKGVPAAAEHGLEMAIKLAPDEAQLHYTLGTTLEILHRSEDAQACFEHAVRLDPGYSDAFCNLGIVQKANGDFDGACASFLRAIKLDSGHDDAQWNLSLTQLQMGDYVEGFRGYESRRCIAGVREASGTAWDGSEQKGKTLLVLREQGMGDTFQFMRFLEPARQRVGRLIFAHRKPLGRLLKDVTGIDELVVMGSAPEADPEHDLWAPIMSLPYLLGYGEDLIVRGGAYLEPERDLCTKWANRYPAGGRLKVGICWQGNPTYLADYKRSIPLSHLAPILEAPSLECISLQKVHGLEQLEGLPMGAKLENLGPELDDHTGAFCDTAAVMKQLDLVLTSDTSTAHLAGALNVPTWLMLAKVPDWRWERVGESCRWYPSMRLFRQSEAGDWAPVVAAVLENLKELEKPHG
jgi:hypothetical protein